MPLGCGDTGARAACVVEAYSKRIRRDDGHRYQVKCADGVSRPAPSVTAVIENMDKPFLVRWAARSQYEADLEAAWNLYKAYPLGFPRWKFEALFQAEVGSLKAHERLLQQASAHGTEVHEAIEADLR